MLSFFYMCKVKTCIVLLVTLVWILVLYFHITLTRSEQHQEREKADMVIDKIFAARRREKNEEQMKLTNLATELNDVGLIGEKSPVVLFNQQDHNINTNKKNIIPKFAEFVYVTPVEKAWKNTKPLRKSFIMPLHRKLPVETKPLDMNGNLLYPVISNIQPLDFDDVMTSGGKSTSALSMISESPSFKTTNDASAATKTATDNRSAVNDVLQAQMEYKAYMDSILSEQKLNH